MQARLHRSVRETARGYPPIVALLLGLGACSLERTGTSALPDNSESRQVEGGDDEPGEGDLSALEPDQGSGLARLDAGRIDASGPRRSTAGRDAMAAEATRNEMTGPGDPDGGPNELGAGEDAGADADGAMLEPAFDAEADGAPSKSCALDGSLSAEIMFKVDWRGTTLAGIVPVLKAGQGYVRVVARVDLRDNPNRVRSHVTACGAALPDFAASWLIGELYAAHFPDESWDQPSMPSWNLDWDFACKEPKCALTSDVIVATIGARANPRDMWPGRMGPIEQVTPVDHDDDDLPGYTLISRNGDERDPSGKPYSEIPVHWTLNARASRAAIALQLAAEFSGTMEDCDSLVGAVTSGRIEARAVGCIARSEADGAEQPCTEEQTGFLDTNLPDWTVSGGYFRARRVAPDADCAAVRAVWE